MKAMIIGLGTIGKVHAGILLDQGIELVGVCDIDSTKLQAYPEEIRYTDYVKMLDEVQADVVHICTPHYLHTEMVLASLARNINTLCEKPLCMDKKDIPRILEAERASSAQLGVCFQNRYLPESVVVRDMLKNEKVISAHGRVVWQRDEAYYRQYDWHGRRNKEGGGVLINQAIHTLDLLQWLLGMPKALSAYCANLSLQGIIDVEDTASVYCFGETDFSLLATNAGRGGFPVEVELRTEDKRILIKNNILTVNGVATDYTSKIPKYGKDCYGMGHWPLFADFYDCVKTGRKFPIDGQEGAKASTLVLTAYESDGKKVAL